MDNFSLDKKLSDYTSEELLWNRPNIEQKYFDDITVVFGHTPTVYYGDEHKGKMLFTDTWIDIDVGAGLGLPPAILRLDDMKTYLTEYALKNRINEIGDITYTEFEYITAKYLKVDVLAFVARNIDEKIENGKVSGASSRMYLSFREEGAYNESFSANIVVSALNNYFKNTPNAIGWIRETESKIYHSAELAGISDISLATFFDVERLKKLLNNSTELNIIFTTGKTFFISNSSCLTEFVANGGNIKFLCVEPQTEEMKKIQFVEEMEVHSSRETIHEEFGMVMVELMEILIRAKQKNEHLENDIGTIQVGFCNSLLRSSFVLFLNSITHKNKGWFNITLPPAKSRETISFEIEAVDDRNITNNLFERSLQHFESLWKFALENQNVFNVEDGVDKKYISSSNAVKSYWEQKQKNAIITMKKRKRMHSVLIEVAAQHPLKDGCEPGEEFKKRLDVAIELFNSKRKDGIDVEIYVPGSRHLDFDGIPDDVSLSSAGTKYLIDNGVPENIVHGDDLNNKYDIERFHKGVYNSADECFVCSKYFFDDTKDFGSCYSICSPNQAFRKMLLYLEFGIYPKILTSPADNMFHDFINELFTAIPYVVNEDHSYQDENSKEALKTRKERMP